jgi:hypothetical protein
MSSFTEVKARGVESNVETYRQLTVSDKNPNGLGPWAGDATDKESAKWQAHLDANGTLPSDGRLTRDETQLAKWVAVTEEVNHYASQDKEVPKSLQSRAEKTWDKKFSEPKVAKRQQTIQMFLSLPAALRDQMGGYPEGILWSTLENPMNVEDLGNLVVQAFPKSTYKNDLIGRMKTDIDKFNNGAFACMRDGDTVHTPPTKYRKLGLPERAAAKSNEEGAEVVK